MKLAEAKDLLESLPYETRPDSAIVLALTFFKDRFPGENIDITAEHDQIWVYVGGMSMQEIVGELSVEDITTLQRYGVFIDSDIGNWSFYA